MPYSLLADLVLLLHLGFILFSLLGGLLVLWRGWVLWLHLPALAWAIWVEATGSLCPLTPLEMRLLALAGRQGWQGDFISQHLLPLIYPPGLSRPGQMALVLLVVGVNCAVYGLLWRRQRHKRRAPRPRD